jgi:hypothetical protein
MRVPDAAGRRATAAGPLGRQRIRRSSRALKNKHASAVPTRLITRSSLATLPDQTASPRAGSVWSPRETSPGSERVSR